MAFRWLGVAFVVAGCGPFESGVACTDMGCEDGLSIAFSLSEPGDYTFEVIADGVQATCSATLPLPPCEQLPASSCSSPEVMLGLSGCALPQGQHTLEGISLVAEHPTAVEVIVTRDGTELGRQSFSPSYDRLAPNGEECGPICHHAALTLSL